MNDYRPNLDDIEHLVTHHPDKFSSPLQTRRSINNARGQGVMVEDITAQNQYGDYISKGGTPLGPNGERPPTGAPASDQEFGTPCAACAAAGGCCIKSITFGCSHKDGRMKLPLADASKERRLVLVADQGGGAGHDMLKVEVEHEPNANCCMPQKMPILSLTGDGANETVNGKKMEVQVVYPSRDSWTGTDLELFARATSETIFGDVANLGGEMPFDVCACGGGDQWGVRVVGYPKLEWKASGFSFEISGKFDTAMRFTPGVKFEGKLEGVYGGSTFSIGASGGPETDPQEHSKSVVPFLDRLLTKMQSMTSEGSSSADLNTRSYIEITHKFTLGDSKFKLAEHPSDHSQVGIDGEIYIGYDPLLKILASLDILDLVLTMARGAAPGVADAIIKARESMARGLGDKDGPLHARGHVAFTLKIHGAAQKAGVTLTRSPADDRWSGQGTASAAIGVELEAVLVAEGKAWAIEGAFKAEGSGASEITAEVKTLSQSGAAANGKKLNIKVEWNGLTLKYGYEAQATILGIINTGVERNVGEIPILEKETLYEEDK